MKRLLSLPLLAATLLLAACDVPADIAAPISAPGLAAYDERLVGSWYILGAEEDEADVAMLTITPGSDGSLDVAGFMTSLLRTSDPFDEARHISDDLDTWMVRLTAYPSVIDGKTYFNARLIDSFYVERRSGAKPRTETIALFAIQPERGFWIFRAGIAEDGLLTLYPLWSEELRRLGHAGHEVSCGEDCRFEVFDLSSEELIELIRAAEPGTLFADNLATLARIDTAYPPQP